MEKEITRALTMLKSELAYLSERIDIVESEQTRLDNLIAKSQPKASTKKSKLLSMPEVATVPTVHPEEDS